LGISVKLRKIMEIIFNGSEFWRGLGGRILTSMGSGLLW
jgi:hypothetical protein